ncbi:flagellar protein FlaG [Oceanobacillus sp. CAU 1775]
MGKMAIDKLGGSQVFFRNDVKSTPKVEADQSIQTSSEKVTVESKLYEKYPDVKIRKEDLFDAIEKMNDFLEPTRRNLKFELHDKLNKYYVSVVDSETDEIIKEIPPKKFLDMYAAMAEFMGLLVDQKI